MPIKRPAGSVPGPEGGMRMSIDGEGKSSMNEVVPGTMPGAGSPKNSDLTSTATRSGRARGPSLSTPPIPARTVGKRSRRSRRSTASTCRIATTAGLVLRSGIACPSRANARR